MLAVAEGTGLSAHALIQEALFTVARQLLSKTQFSVSQIAAALHYGDSAAFSNAFRRWSRLSPRKWRNVV
ncbi:MAG: helix-turn-helix domain-containing protein [Betaproteobacteria bacterium]|nr:helix-turn-helix domain-containing protein [Betaproteobacteria bacterium]